MSSALGPEDKMVYWLSELASVVFSTDKRAVDLVSEIGEKLRRLSNAKHQEFKRMQLKVAQGSMEAFQTPGRFSRAAGLSYGSTSPSTETRHSKKVDRRGRRLDFDLDVENDDEGDDEDRKSDRNDSSSSRGSRDSDHSSDEEDDDDDGNDGGAGTTARGSGRRSRSPPRS